MPLFGRHLPGAASRNQKTSISLNQVSSGGVGGMEETNFVWDRERCIKPCITCQKADILAGPCRIVSSAKKECPFVRTLNDDSRF
jgi:hypothetical protein